MSTVFCECRECNQNIDGRCEREYVNIDENGACEDCTKEEEKRS